MIPERLCFLPVKKVSEVTLFHLPSAHLPDCAFQHLHHWERSATVDYIIKYFIAGEKEKKKNTLTHQKIEQMEDRDGGAEGRAWNKKRRAHVWP